MLNICPADEIDLTARSKAFYVDALPETGVDELIYVVPEGDTYAMYLWEDGWQKVAGSGECPGYLVLSSALLDATNISYNGYVDGDDSVSGVVNAWNGFAFVEGHRAWNPAWVGVAMMGGQDVTSTIKTGASTSPYYNATVTFDPEEKKLIYDGEATYGGETVTAQTRKPVYTFAYLAEALRESASLSYDGTNLTAYDADGNVLASHDANDVFFWTDRLIIATNDALPGTLHSSSGTVTVADGYITYTIEASVVDTATASVRRPIHT